MLDVAGSRPWHACRRVLADHGTFVLVGGPKRNRVLGPVGHIAATLLASRLSRKQAVFFIAKPNQADVSALADLIEAGTTTPVVDRSYELGRLAEAMAYLGQGHARAKVAITLSFAV